MENIHEIDYDNCSSEQWEKVTSAIHSGDKVKVHQSFYNYYLEVLPPRSMFSGGFVFQEGEGEKIRFTHEADGYYAEKVKPLPMTAERLLKYEKQMQWVSNMDTIPAFQGLALKNLRDQAGPGGKSIPAVDMGYTHSGVLCLKTKRQRLFWKDKGWCCEFMGILNADNTMSE